MSSFQNNIITMNILSSLKEENDYKVKLGKHQRNIQRWQDLCWKVHDPALSFALLSGIMHNQNTSEINNYCVLCMVQAKNIKHKHTYNKELCRTFKATPCINYELSDYGLK